MDRFIPWKEVLFTSIKSFFNSLTAFLPTFIGAVLLLILGWVVARSVSFVLYKLLEASRFNKLAEIRPFATYFERANFTKRPSEVIKKVTFWIIMLVFLITAAETLGLSFLSQEISNLLNYLPRLFSAIVLFIIGVYVITFIRDLIRSATASLGISTGKLVSSVVFYLLFILTALTSLKQAGIDITIITSNVTLIIGAILLSAAISYGFASREILENILASFFCRKNFGIGQTIQIDDIKGEIMEMGSTSIRLRTDKGEVLVPNKEFINKKVDLL